MPNQPWLSVIIPTFNGEDYLPFALDSIVSQGDPEIECIAIDDGSTDATLSILTAYQKKLPMRILEQERKGNWAVNTNYGMHCATGDYLCFLHQDDLWLQDRLMIMKRLIIQFPEVILFVHPARYLDSSGNDLGIWRCPLPSFPRTIPWNSMLEKLLVQNFIAMPAPIFRREAAQSTGGLEADYWYTADWDFWLKIAACGDSLYCPQPLAGFRVHPASQTIRRSSEAREFRDQLESVADKHLAQWEAPEKRKEQVCRVARFSIEVNITLASQVHAQKANFGGLFLQFLSLGPAGWYRYIHDSRIWERVSARLKARLKPFRVS